MQRLTSTHNRTPTILVVEDEYLLRVMLTDHLQGCGFKVLDGSSADDAISIIEHAGMFIDVVFSDIRMPGSMNGFGLARWIRANHPAIHVILASGDAAKTDVAKELCENQPFFTKPYDLEAVVAQIHTALAANQ